MVAHHHETETAMAELAPGLDGDFRADSGGVAEADREGPHRTGPGGRLRDQRLSILAELRRSRSSRRAIIDRDSPTSRFSTSSREGASAALACRPHRATR